MIRSMTGFAAARGEGLGFNWVWDIRSVNARGLDIRLRLPDWVEGLDAAVRAAVSKAAARGNISVSLRLQRDAATGGETLDREALTRALAQIAEVDAVAAEAGLMLTRATAADVLALRGVLTSAVSDEMPEGLLAALTADLPALLEAFDTMRRTEGAALAGILSAQFERIGALTEEAATLAEARRDATAQRLREALARVLDNADGADPDRVAQELALIAVKTDVTEELDRLRAHVAAAHGLLGTAEAVGRKLDFLAQEFNREANTLCSKSQSAELTRVGLDLKATIDQMREQVQNVE